jgi:hypothetical protein
VPIEVAQKAKIHDSPLLRCQLDVPELALITKGHWAPQSGDPEIWLRQGSLFESAGQKRPQQNTLKINPEQFNRFVIRRRNGADRQWRENPSM